MNYTPYQNYQPNKKMTPQPEQLANDLHSFYVEQSDLSDRFTALEIEKIIFCNANAEKYKSDTKAERAFYATEHGMEYVKTKLRLKDLTRRISALKSLLRDKEMVARGGY